MTDWIDAALQAKIDIVEEMMPPEELRLVLRSALRLLHTNCCRSCNQVAAADYHFAVDHLSAAGRTDITVSEVDRHARITRGLTPGDR